MPLREPPASPEPNAPGRRLTVFLVRHGQAGRAAEDAERSLTGKGRADIERAARRIAGTSPNLSAVFASPLRRARETAEIIAAELGRPKIAEAPALAPGTDLERLLSLVRENAARESLCLVGHMPELGELAGFLASRRKGHLLELAAGALVCAEIVWDPEENSSLKWMADPGEAA